MDLFILAIGLVVYFVIRFIAYYVALKKTGWMFIDYSKLGAVSFISLIFGVIVPSGPFDFIGILIRFLVMSVFVSVIFDEDLSTSFGMTLIAGVIEVVIGVVGILILPELGSVISPFAVP